MLKGKTENGFEFELDDEVLDDWELLESLREVDRGNEEYIIDAAKLLLGEKQYEDLKTFIKNKYGKIKASIMAMEVVNVLNVSREGKNC